MHKKKKWQMKKKQGGMKPTVDSVHNISIFLDDTWMMLDILYIIHCYALNCDGSVCYAI